MEDKEIIEKTARAVNRMKQFPDLFRLRVQRNRNSKQYFENFNCLYLPEDFLDFMSVLDGLSTEIFTVFSIGDCDGQIIKKFDEYSNPVEVKRYLESCNLKMNPKLFFFASDNVGGRYAFKTDIKEDAVYYLNAINPDAQLTYNSFLDLLNDKIEEYILKRV